MLDPTRFAVTMSRPQIWLGRPDHYDLAGLSIHEGTEPPPPAGTSFELDHEQRRALAHPRIRTRGRRLSCAEIHWLAHRPRYEFTDHRRALAAIVELGCEVLIPINLRQAVLEPVYAQATSSGWYILPPERLVGDAQALGLVFARFAHPDRDARVLSWAEDAGYDCGEVIGAIDALARAGAIASLGRAEAAVLGELAMEFLGNGNAPAIEAFVEHEGISLAGLDRALRHLGAGVGLDLGWI